MSYEEWRHVFKLDPAKEIDDEALEQICESGTDAIIVGGTDGVTLDNTLALLSRVRRYAVTCGLEVSTIPALTPGFDYYFVPTILNTNDGRWITGIHQEALKEFGPLLETEEVIAEGYCVLNKDAKVALLTGANTALTGEDVAAYARLADQLFRLPIFYLEYSGTYGNAEVVKRAKTVLKHSRLFYGGGIRTKQEAEEMAAIADTVVVGNIIYEDLQSALRTVQVVKETSQQ
ncbi:heptaprenylglyceryl phosphate synthase [Aliibacillus thermotolerans]|uniref:Heptaprenylglyceryl phosphate synthase n=1 Tax=Aliibacillus thermotolerans TaxID=1834418 RepID=A0ABW0U756_9BACI|nr:heptaprenylglyceryl phosphate synthase [Aliibacillus thermotolerans]MDA3130394.1 heptaprenylglyceryl phosphate synthase [Aliibacillus thermotolerans]